MGVSTKFTVGSKDSRLLRAPEGPYERLVRIAAQTDVVVHDTMDKRAWLIDGATALLHIRRAGLTSPHAPIEPLLSIENRFIHKDNLTPGRMTATDILLDKSNRKLVLYDGEGKHGQSWCFEDLVLENWSILGEIRSQQAKIQSSESKWEIRNPFTVRLEGFEFNELVSGVTPIRPRCAKLEASGAKWIQFTNKCGAINIIGSGFGELLRPAVQDCEGCIELPHGVDFLAAPIGRLYSIAQRYGRVESYFLELVHGIFWNDPSSSFGSSICRCISGICGKTVSELQEKRQPSPSTTRQATSSLLEHHPLAAIIIGLESALRSPPMPTHAAKTSLPTQRLNLNRSAKSSRAFISACRTLCLSARRIKDKIMTVHFRKLKKAES